MPNFTGDSGGRHLRNPCRNCFLEGERPIGNLPHEVRERFRILGKCASLSRRICNGVKSVAVITRGYLFDLLPVTDAETLSPIAKLTLGLGPILTIWPAKSQPLCFPAFVPGRAPVAQCH